MKYQLLILWILAGFVSCQNKDQEQKNEVKVEEIGDGLKLTCNNNELKIKRGKKEIEGGIVSYHDDNTGEYQCNDNSKIFVKFRTCDNCVELDTSSIVGLAVGDVVATIVVGVAVYLIASQARAGQVKPTKKRSDKQNLIRNEVPGESSYQPLRYKKGDKAEYDVLNRK